MKQSHQMIKQNNNSEIPNRQKKGTTIQKGRNNF